MAWFFKGRLHILLRSQNFQKKELFIVIHPKSASNGPKNKQGNKTKQNKPTSLSLKYKGKNIANIPLAIIFQTQFWITVYGYCHLSGFLELPRYSNPTRDLFLEQQFVVSDNIGSLWIPFLFPLLQHLWVSKEIFLHNLFMAGKKSTILGRITRERHCQSSVTQGQLSFMFPRINENSFP